MEQVLSVLGKLLSISLIRYFLIAGIPFALCYMRVNEWLNKSKIQARHAAKKDFLREILYSLQTTAVIVLLVYFVLYTPFNRYTRIYVTLTANDWWYISLSIILCLIIHDTYFYWMHRLMHHPKLFKHSHLLHHRSTNPSPWASYSFHLIEAWLEGFILVIVVFAIPMHPIAIMLFSVITFLINVYGHLGYEIAPRQFRQSLIFEILNTSVHHNMHHSKFKGNYGLYFRIWDRLLGTEHPDYVKEYDRIQEKRFGKVDH